MRKISVFLIIIAGFLSCAAISVSADQGVEFSLSLERPEITEYKTQDPIKLIFKLKNSGNDPVYVNKRFLLGPEESPVSEREVYLSVISPSGQKLPYKFPYKSGLPKSDYFVLLKSGDEAAADYPRAINGTFEFNEPGEYRITAVYENAYGAEIGLTEVFKERLTSNTLMIKVVK
ncbi:MAG: hypothetical protein WC569_04570 [Candidatus Omnitrophota bacterium]